MTYQLPSDERIRAAQEAADPAALELARTTPIGRMLAFDHFPLGISGRCVCGYDYVGNWALWVAHVIGPILDMRVADQPNETHLCPDGGTCHHVCAPADCFRVRCCGPLSGVFPGDTWPADVEARVAAAQPPSRRHAFDNPDVPPGGNAV
ncbi:hypothetical protein [Nocardia sp. NPDC057030]|uniref:hypothetical protein n=1 Tax=unclassified Nocardia TaxID=2637762 RepID=UPI00363A4783